MEEDVRFRLIWKLHFITEWITGTGTKAEPKEFGKRYLCTQQTFVPLEKRKEKPFLRSNLFKFTDGAKLNVNFKSVG